MNCASQKVGAKRGMFYTMVVILFMSILLAMFFAGNYTDSFSDARQSRVTAMDDFLTDFHRDADRAAYISGFRTLIGLEEIIAETGAYLTDTEAVFIEVFLNASYNNNTLAVVDNASFGDYLQRVSYEAQKVGMILNVSVNSVDLYHITPWEVAVDYELQIRLRDIRAETRWDYTKTLSTTIPIRDLRDPVYTVETNGRAPNVIAYYDNFTEYVDDAGDKNDTTVLLSHLNNSYYRASNTGPSFLQRMEGDFTAHPYGVESLVDLNKLDAQGITVETDRSLVDYIYFTTALSADQCSIQNMPNYFKLDDAHMNVYEIDGELEYSACP